MKLLQETLDSITGLDPEKLKVAQERVDGLSKPPGSMGKLEEIAVQLGGMGGTVWQDVSKKAAIVMCADNGIALEGVTSCPQELTRMVAELMVVEKAGINVLTGNAGGDVFLVDLGMASDINHPKMLNRKVRYSTENFRNKPAMTREEAIQSIEEGIRLVDELVQKGYRMFGAGEVGMGNTTTSSAILYSFVGGEIEKLVGRGAGLTDEALQNKMKIVKEAVDFHNPDRNDPIDILAKVGGLDIGGMAGIYLGAAKNRVPAVIDGFMSGVAAVLAYKLKPECKQYLIPSHGSEEPGTVKVMDILGMEPMLNMNMRLGEGTGAALAFYIVDCATKMMTQWGKFAELGTVKLDD
ncbi:MAG: nicotinate-nucleotide--dimethylbenzimidazole phosphoribosyltransferase [Candidatus Cloacimonetes bacterium]|nr:nicotinate-nucleotide--dimethylbenzimidazole phosphoribosyltransferase [Candidatus Cloacimonadota bacterium]